MNAPVQLHDPCDDLFNTPASERPKLAAKDNVIRLAKLKNADPQRFEELIAGLKANKVPRLRELEEEIKKVLKSAEARGKRPPGRRYEVDDAFERDDKSGSILPTQGNIRLAIDKLGVTLSFDAFARRPIIAGLENFGPTLDDNAETRLWLEIDGRFHFRPRKDFFHAVVFDACLLNQFHPVCRYLDGLTWDGKPRLDTWLVNYCGVEDSPYTRAVGRIMLIAAVRRVRRPGSKHDEMLTLESPEGFNKSTLLQELAVNEEWFSDSLPLNVDDKRMIENASGKWIIEISELQGMRKADAGLIKAQLSRRRDRARLAYDRMPSEVDRQCVFFGTVNPAEATGYLASLTGNRRFWPVEVKRIDLEAFKADRDQLWAEASAREAKGESTRLDPALWDAAMQQQKKREAPNPILDRLLPWLGHREGLIYTNEIWTILEIPVAQRASHYERLGKAMKDMGWRHVKRRRARGGTKVGAYARGNGAQIITVERDRFNPDEFLIGVEYATEVETDTET